MAVRPKKGFFSLHSKLLVTLLLSTVFHGVAFYISYVYFEGGKVGRKEFHVRFVSPPPILKKSFDLAKRPEISEVQMEMLSIMAKPRDPSGLSDLSSLSSLGGDILAIASPGSKVGYSMPSAKPAAVEFKSVKMAALTNMATSVQEVVSLQSELLSVENLDTGRYKSIIIQDPEDKKKLRGYFNMTLVKFNHQNPDTDVYPLAIPNLLRYMNDATNLRASIVGQKIELSDPELFTAPIIYMTGHECVVELSPIEKENLKDYLYMGGFIFIDDIAPDVDGNPNPKRGLRGTAFDQQMKGILREVLGSDARFFRIPKDHPVYHSFYDFDDGPPLGGATGGNVTYLEGIEIRGRLAVLFSDLNVSWYWGEQNATGKERGLQFGVNIVVYALTQPGGLANISQYTM